MQKVLEQAQLLGEAIINSEVFNRMHDAEVKVTSDPEATNAIAAFVEKRQAVEALLAENGVDHEALAKAGQEMEEAEKAVNEVALVKELQEARSMFSLMMDNVNRILKIMITGEDEQAHDCGDCSGGCGGCSGCSH